MENKNTFLIKFIKYGTLCLGLGFLICLLQRFQNIYQNKGSYVEVTGEASQTIVADKAIIRFSILNYANNIIDSMDKQNTDIQEIKKFLLSKFKEEEIKILPTENKLNWHKTEQNNEKSFEIITPIVITTYNIDAAKKLRTQLYPIIEKNITHSIDILYLFNNIEDIIDNLTKHAIMDSSNDASRFAKIMGKTSWVLQSSKPALITYKATTNDKTNDIENPYYCYLNNTHLPEQNIHININTKYNIT